MKLAEFAAWAIRSGAFNGTGLDGDDIQEKAIECGLIIETKYDPDVHGHSEASEYVSPGDRWFVFSDDLKAALSAGVMAR